MPMSSALNRLGHIAHRIEQRMSEPSCVAIDVDSGIRLIRNAALEKLRSAAFLERELIPALGLNNEMTSEQPKSLSEHFGKGCGWRIWQYPNQFSRYLAWLSQERINSYIEIGTRFGGTFVLTCEFLARFNPDFSKPMAIDLIDEPPLLTAYRKFRQFDYFCGSSQSAQFAKLISDRRFDLALIDGDHTFPGVMADFRLMQPHAERIVFHDITSTACPDVGNFWSAIKTFTGRDAKFFEFIDQYQDVPAKGPFLGIGVMQPSRPAIARAD